MSCNKTYFPDEFFLVGISYKNTDAVIRGQFAISYKQYESILQLAPSLGVQEMFVLSTCNRTEIYGFTKNVSSLMELLYSQTSADYELLLKMAYIKNGTEAISHLFDVACGLDSQILGDYEIVSQLKQAVSFSRDHKFMGTFLEKLVSSVLQSSKKIKTNTKISSGSVSVSFSAARYIKEKTNFNNKSKILVLGAGKIGRNTCKNLLRNFKAENITVINRSIDKAITLANELNINYAALELLALQLQAAEIIIVATNSIEPVILKSNLENKGKKIIIDLSMPTNVESAVNDLRNIKVIHVDEISKLKDDNLKKRAAEVPKAKLIIDVQIQELMQWVEMRKQIPVLNSIKSKLKDINQLVSLNIEPNQNRSKKESPEKRIQNVINGIAVKMLESDHKGCHYIEAINRFIMADAN